MLVIRAFDNITCETNTKQDFKLQTIKCIIHVFENKLLTPCISNDPNIMQSKQIYIMQSKQIYIYIHIIKFQFVSNSCYDINDCESNAI